LAALGAGHTPDPRHIARIARRSRDRRFLADMIDADDAPAGIEFATGGVAEDVAVTFAVRPARIFFGHGLRIFGKALIRLVSVAPVGAPQRDDADASGITWAVERVPSPAKACPPLARGMEAGRPKPCWAGFGSRQPGPAAGPDAPKKA